VEEEKIQHNEEDDSIEKTEPDIKEDI